MKKNRFLKAPVSIRHAEAKDATTISSLYFEWLNFGERKGRLQQIRKSISAKEIMVAADSTGKPFGFIQGVMLNDPISSGPVLYIDSFYLQQEYRHKGIGSQLLSALLERAIRQGVVGAEVATARPAFRLYKNIRLHPKSQRLSGSDGGIEPQEVEEQAEAPRLHDEVEN